MYTHRSSLVYIYIYIHIYIYTSVLLCVYTHRQQEVKLSSGYVCDVDLVESLNHKNYPQFLSQFLSKSYRQRQSHYPKAIVNVNHTILLAIVHVNHTGLGWGLGSWGPGVLGSWGPGVLGSWDPGLLGLRSWVCGPPSCTS